LHSGEARKPIRGVVKRAATGRNYMAFLSSAAGMELSLFWSIIFDFFDFLCFT
jgi:hypothetical protein